MTYYERRKATNLCTRCMKRPADDGKILCAECRAKNRKYYIDDRNNGRCTICHGQARPGMAMCEWCAKRNAIIGRMRYQRLKEQGLCVHCGKNPPTAGKTTCAECDKKYRR